MATKRTHQHKSAAEASARADLALSDFLNSADSILATPPPTPPMSRMPRGSIAPATPAPEAEVLVAADTLLTPNPLLTDDDHIELLEESGLLQLEPDGLDEHNAIEVSSSFLIEDVDGYPAAEPTQDIEEIASEYLAFVETRGEIHKVDRPGRAISDAPSVDIAGLHEEGLSNLSARYSDGVPVYSRQSQGLSSKTLRVPAPKNPGHPLLRKLAVAAVFAAGIGVGIGFALTSQPGSKASPVAVVETAANLAPDLEASGDESATPAAIEAPESAALPPTGAPIVEPMDADEAALALALLEDNSEDNSEDARVEALVEATEEAEARDVEVADMVVEDSAFEDAQIEDHKAAPRKARKSSRVKSAATTVGPTPAAADPGVLMLAAKPPCEIRIDGNITGLMTPQRVLRLSPGKHRVTLINDEHQIRDSFKVSIVSGQKTRIVRDNTSKIK